MSLPPESWCILLCLSSSTVWRQLPAFSPSWRARLRLANHLVSFYSQKVSLEKHNFIYALFGYSQVIQKVGQSRSNRPAPVRACQFPFLHLNSSPLTTPTDINLPCFYVLQLGGGGFTHSPKIGTTIVWLFYDNIMITLATNLVEKFYTYW
jgi:hypothetical protein